MLLKLKSPPLLVAACFLSICEFAEAADFTISNYIFWDKSSHISNWSIPASGNAHTYGQLIYMDTSPDNKPLYYNSFSLYFKLLSGTPLNYVFSIYKADGSQYPNSNPVSPNPLSTTISPIFSTGVLTAPSTTDSFTKVTYDLGGLRISSSGYYLASISTNSVGGGDGLYGLAGFENIYNSTFETGFRFTDQMSISAPWSGLNAAAVYELNGFAYDFPLSQ